MTTKEPSLTGAYALHVIEIAAAHGIDAAKVLEGLEVGREALAAPGARVRLRDLAVMARRVGAWIHEPGLAVLLGRRLSPATHGALGMALLTAPTVGDSMAVGERYFAARSTAVSVRIVSSEASAAFVVTPPASLAREDREFAVLTGLVMLLTVADTIADRPLGAVADSTLSAPEYAARFPELARVRFGAPENRIVVPGDTLAWPLRLADAVSHQLACAECARELVALGAGSDLVSRVRNALATSDGFRSLEDVAKRLHVSTRSLKRHLAEEGTSYREVLDDLRRQKALLLLGDASLGVDAVATRLGYADTPGFVRAFRRWTKMTPTEYRGR